MSTTLTASSARSSARSRSCAGQILSPAGGPLTVPEIAAAIGSPTHEVLFWVMGMRRYGTVVEVREPSDDGLLPLRSRGGKEGT